ncbi:RICIN domain-containing protein [Tardiphaga sp.]|jgi:hypothetical protein|uniref:RICIN domain-containing protein n=1 Tax=Tardiphaga sp. TaxID=1926292 RepID=UPI0037D9FF42
MIRLLAGLCTFILSLTGAVQAQDAGSTYAIQNVMTGKNLRPHSAGRADGNAIIQYDHWSWKCMTWQFIPVGENTYQLRNLHTSKTLQPSAAPVPQVALWQQPVADDRTQYWEFVADRDDAYLVRLKGTNLYLTTLSRETNSQIVLQNRQNSSAQQWRLVRQNPWF